MPRNQTTGAFTRVSNSFSNPVVGTPIAPSDADSYFDDVDSGLTFTDTSPLILVGSTSGVTKLIAEDAASGTVIVPAGDSTLVSKTSTDNLTGKTFDTAGSGNSLSINGVAVTANTGTGAVARAASPTFTGTVGAAAITATGLMTSAGGQFNGLTIPSTGAGVEFFYNAGVGYIQSYERAPTPGFKILEINAATTTFGGVPGDVIISSSTVVTSSSVAALAVAGGIYGGALLLGGLLGLKSYTVGTLPAGATGAVVYATNLRVFNGAGTQESGGNGTGGTVEYNGSAWKIAGTNITAVA